MPKVFLSPSTQEYNPYADGGTEEYYMNLVADAMEPYLTASGVEYARNDPSGTVNDSVALSNASPGELHLALHSNAAPPSLSGKLTGADIYYFTGSEAGRRAAELFAENYRRLYPYPEKVRVRPTRDLIELRRTKASAILIECAYHDNPEEARWIRENIGEMGENFARSAVEYVGASFRQPQDVRYGIVATESGSLRLRTSPSLDAAVLAVIPKGTRLPLLGEDGAFYLTRFAGKEGYAAKEYIRPES